MQSEFEAARKPSVNAFAADAGTALRNCQGRVDALVDRVRRTAAEIFNIPLGPETKQDLFELGEDPYRLTASTRASLHSRPGRVIDNVLPAALRRPRIRARMVKLAEELIIRNAENLRWAILRGLDETFRKATAQFEDRLDEMIEATRGAIQDALARGKINPSRSGRSSNGLVSRKLRSASLREELHEPAMTMAGGLTRGARPAITDDRSPILFR